MNVNSILGWFSFAGNVVSLAAHAIQAVEADVPVLLSNIESAVNMIRGAAAPADSQ